MTPWQIVDTMKSASDARVALDEGEPACITWITARSKDWLETEPHFSAAMDICRLTRPDCDPMFMSIARPIVSTALDKSGGIYILRGILMAWHSLPPEGRIAAMYATNKVAQAEEAVSSAMKGDYVVLSSIMYNVGATEAQFYYDMAEAGYKRAGEALEWVKETAAWLPTRQLNRVVFQTTQLIDDMTISQLRSAYDYARIKGAQLWQATMEAGAVMAKAGIAAHMIMNLLAGGALDTLDALKAFISEGLALLTSGGPKAMLGLVSKTTGKAIDSAGNILGGALSGGGNAVNTLIETFSF